MQVTVNGKEHNIPFHLSDITLGRFIEYYDQYGKDLDNELDEILKKDYTKALTAKGYKDITEEDIKLHKDIDLDNHIDKEALAWYSFWTGHDFFEVQDEPFIVPVLSQYRVLKYLMHEEMQQVYEFPQDIEWKDEVWSIQAWTVTPASEMKASEIFTSKEILLQTHNLGLSRWQALVYLCVVFLRKKGEAFSNDLVMDGSKRMGMMMELPLIHALKVSFFLNGCVNFLKHTLAYSTEKEQPIQSLQ